VLLCQYSYSTSGLFSNGVHKFSFICLHQLVWFEMRCYCRILKICWKGKVSNKTIRDRDKVERQHDIVELIKQFRKVKLFGHICRMKDEWLLKMAMLGVFHGDRHHGTLAEDDITDWCDCAMSEAVRLTTNRNEWRRITGFSSTHGPWVHRRRRSSTGFIGELLSESWHPFLQESVDKEGMRSNEVFLSLL